ncbi:MAG: 50S ribosomal protein L1 [Gammaproteobacteria bacterium GWE2_42_36]|nr:MAG: 50S ribosomal protein L1 [Gammaproteobacteria bacterium GWE2_42_36]HCU05832.1 50S ribosomal protein L1 [Coxiellaceae bacterium]
MAKISKRMQAIRNTVKTGIAYAAKEAFEQLKSLSKVKFVESVDVSVNLGIDPKKTEQAVRGAVLLPKGTGRTVKVAVFTQGVNADKAKAAGADAVGYDDLAARAQAGDFPFDVVIATPDAMSLVGKLGPILGPRGLMPNPKVGTVTADVETAIKNVKAGQARYRTDKAGIIHCSIGTLAFSPEDLKLNLETLLIALKKAKPSSSKGIFLKKITVSTTMGPGMLIDQGSLEI